MQMGGQYQEMDKIKLGQTESEGQKKQRFHYNQLSLHKRHKMMMSKNVDCKPVQKTSIYANE